MFEPGQVLARPAVQDSFLHRECLVLVQAEGVVVHGLGPHHIHLTLRHRTDRGRKPRHQGLRLRQLLAGGDRAQTEFDREVFRRAVTHFDPRPLWWVQFRETRQTPDQLRINDIPLPVAVGDVVAGLFAVHLRHRNIRRRLTFMECHSELFEHEFSLPKKHSHGRTLSGESPK
nr:hypothetical protein [Kibdelosporangium sp. MJ126-NF4]